MFTTDTHFQVWVGFSPVLSSHTHQLPHAFTVECLEWIGSENFYSLLCSWLLQPIDVLQQELALGIVTADAKGRLSQIIRAKAEEFGYGCDLAGSQTQLLEVRSLSRTYTQRQNQPQK